MAYNTSEKTSTFRVPSTANLQVDSTDRPNPYQTSVVNFAINKPESILNGFFTRVGLTEIVLEWDTPNIQSRANNTTLIVDISGTGILTTVQYPNQFCGSAANLFNGLVTYMNDLSGTTGHVFSINNLRTPLAISTYQLICDTSGGAPAFFRFANTPLAYQLNLYGNNPGELPGLGFGPYQPYFEPTAPDLRLLRFVDFVSPALTVNQELRDAATNSFNTDVLARWYFGYEEENQLDEYNFPIYQGYSPFVIRRPFSLPKQIRWDPTTPIGQLTFQLFGEIIAKDITRNVPYGLLNISTFGTQYLLTLQVSEN